MMLTQTHLPIMETENFKSVYGSLKFSIQERKLSVVLGAPGSGKTTVLKMLESENPTRNHYILCSPNTTMKSMLLAIADAINTDVKGDNDRIQTQITAALQEDPNHCIIFDECEYLHRGNVSKIDVLRQIYDQTGVPFVLCGTYKLKNLLVGNDKDEHNQPQIFRRLLKSEFNTIKKEEILSYLDRLEKLYAVSFSQEARTQLFSLCRDRGNGGLGIFIALLELIFSIVRPEWKDITKQIQYQETQKKNSSLGQKDSTLDCPPKQNDSTEDPAIPENTDNLPFHFVDVSKLNVVVIDKNTIRDASKFKMTK